MPRRHTLGWTPEEHSKKAAHYLEQARGGAQAARQSKPCSIQRMEFYVAAEQNYARYDTHAAASGRRLETRDTAVSKRLSALYWDLKACLKVR